MSKLRELLERHRAGEELDAGELDTVVAEYERVAEAREQRDINFAIGRKTAGELRRAHGDRCRDVWLAEAIAVQRECRKPLSLKALALSVYERCAERGITKQDGTPHNPATIYNHLAAESERLRATPEGSTTQASAVEQGENSSAIPGSNCK